MTLTSTRTESTARPTLPMRALLSLGAATLVMVTAEMLPTAVLLPMSAGLDVDESLTGQLVAVWALTVVVASLPLSRLTRRIDRRSIIVGALVVLAVSALATGLAPAFGAALSARLVGAASVGLLWATANAHVADLVPEEVLGRAIAIVLGGATLGMVLGTPLARVVADVSSWRIAFVVLALAALAVAVLVRAVVPRLPRRTAETTSGSGEARTSLAPTLVVTGLVGLLLVGFYGTYTFVTRIGEPAADLLPGGMSSLLLSFGLASAVGVALAGRVSWRPAAGLVAASSVTALALLALVWADAAALGLATILVLGLATGALPPLAQTEILRRAGSTHRDVASGLIPVVFNGGIAAGASAASLVVGMAGGTSALPLPAAAAAAMAAIGLAIATRSGSRRRTPGPVRPRR